MKPYQIKLTYKGKQYQFAMLSNADDIEQSLRERFPGCECEISTTKHRFNTTNDIDTTKR